MGILAKCVNAAVVVRRTLNRVRRKVKRAPHKSIPAVVAVAAGLAVTYHTVQLRNAPETPRPVEWSTSGSNPPSLNLNIPGDVPVLRVDRNIDLDIIPKQCWIEFPYPAS